MPDTSRTIRQQRTSVSLPVDDVVAYLVRERERLGLSLRDTAVAQASGLTKSPGLSLATLHRYERRLTVPDLAALEAWAGALGFDLMLELRPREQG